LAAKHISVAALEVAKQRGGPIKQSDAVVDFCDIFAVAAAALVASVAATTAAAAAAATAVDAVEILPPHVGCEVAGKTNADEQRGCAESAIDGSGSAAAAAESIHASLYARTAQGVSAMRNKLSE
jgi:hypothetical protein